MADICPNCGAPSEKTISKNEKKSTKNTAVLFFGALIVVPIIIIIIFEVIGNSNQTFRSVERGLEASQHKLDELEDLRRRQGY